MLSRSFFATSLVSLCLAGAAAVTGCSLPNGESGEDSAEASESELTTAAKALVGKYYASATQPSEYGRLTLGADGTYVASVDITDVAVCVTTPCLGPESGSWNAVRSGGKLRIRLRAEGGPSRWYDAAKTAGVLTLERAGKIQALRALEPNACLDNADCSAAEECGPKLCMMWCAADDPFCCGPSTCQPKPTTPTPTTCVDDADCSAGEKCDPGVCMTWCAPGDDSCCGPSTCQPAAPPAPGTM